MSDEAFRVVTRRQITLSPAKIKEAVASYLRSKGEPSPHADATDLVELSMRDSDFVFRWDVDAEECQHEWRSVAMLPEGGVQARCKKCGVVSNRARI